MKKYCPNCRMSHEHDREETHHFIHLMLSILFIPWVAVWMFRYSIKGFVCPKCKTVNK